MNCKSLGCLVQVCWFDFDKWSLHQNLRKDITMSSCFDDPSLVALIKQWSLLEDQDTLVLDLNFDSLIPELLSFAYKIVPVFWISEMGSWKHWRAPSCVLLFS